MKKKFPPRQKNVSGMVTDQPGFLVFFLGVGVALILGLLFRGLFSPEKILNLVRTAASQIHRDVTIEIGSAELSLSKNGWPRLAVLIKDVSMKSGEPCWMSAELHANEILLPISLKNILEGENAVDVISAGQVQLKLNGEWQLCQPKEKNEIFSAPSGVKIPKTVSLIPLGDQTAPVQADLRELQISEFQLIHPDLRSMPLHLRDLVLTVKSAQPRILTLKAQSQFFNEGHQRDYTSKAEIHVEYTEFPEKILQSHILGQFREGHFTVHLQNRLDENQYNLEVDLRHLPLSKIFSTLHEYGTAIAFNPKQAWLSLKGRSRGFVDKIESESFEVKDLKLEGDIGELHTELIEFSNLKPLKMRPFLMKAEELNLGKIFSFYSASQPSTVLGEIGRFTGRVEVFNPNEIRLFGLHHGLEFVFSNLGQRQLQKINQVSLDASFKNKKWNVKLNRFDLDQGRLDGELQFTTDQDFQKAEMKVRTDELILSPDVQTLITQGGRLGSLKGNLNFSWVQGELQKILGSMSIDEVVINSMKIEDAHWQFDPPGEHIASLKTRFQTLTVPQEFLRESFLGPVLQPQWLVDGQLHLNKVNGQMYFDRNRKVQWKNYQAFFTGAGEKISADGQWGENGQLQGSLSLKSAQKTLRWKIEGTRDKPRLEEVSDGSAIRVESAAD